MDNQIAIIAKQNGLTSENKLNELMRGFADNFAKAKKVAEEAKDITVTDESQIDLMQTAREKRLELKAIRVDVEKTRKELKDDSVREGKAIDGVANIIKALIVPVENHLEKQEKYAETIRLEKLARIKAERENKLSKYVDDISLYNLDGMNDDVFDKLLENAKIAFEAKIESEKQAEAKRLADQEAERKEQERIRKENEELKKLAEKREKELKLEREKQLEIERKKEEERRLEIEKQNKKLEEERKKREAIEEQIRLEKEKERLEKERIEEEQKKKLLAPDKDKLLILANEIKSVFLPAVASNQANEIIKFVDESINKLAKEIIIKANNLK